MNRISSLVTGLVALLALGSGAWFIIPEALRSDAAVKGILEEHAKPLFEAFRKRLPALREKHK